jgi:ribosomal protein S18 acetylase RimI-like enzyme
MTVVEPASMPRQLDEVRTLFLEYAGTLDIDLDFQGFAEELRDLPGEYAPPTGTLLVARDGDVSLGCVALRRIDGETAEMKRLFVRPADRGRGVGRLLAEAVIAFARSARYHRIRLDTLPSMTQAHGLYHRLGFRPIPPYRHNPVPGAEFLELALSRGSG